MFLCFRSSFYAHSNANSIYDIVQKLHLLLVTNNYYHLQCLFQINNNIIEVLIKQTTHKGELFMSEIIKSIRKEATVDLLISVSSIVVIAAATVALSALPYILSIR